MSINCKIVCAALVLAAALPLSAAATDMDARAAHQSAAAPCAVTAIWRALVPEDTRSLLAQLNVH